MIDPRVLDELSSRLSKLLPPGAAEVKADVERNLRASLQAALARMDLVTREEFAVQSAVLQYTREKLEELEAQVAALETRLLQQDQAPAD
jgi:BMFP domain-containing protein YqiC